MRNGFRIYDSDTHVMPAAEVLERYVDPEFRPRLAELAAYRVPIRQSAEHSGGGHNYRVATQYYRRILGEVPRADHRARESNWRGSQLPPPGVADAQPALLPRLSRCLGQHLHRPPRVASLGRDAVCRLVHRRRYHGPLSEPAARRPRMRLWLAAVLGPAHGRAIRLCRLDAAAQDEAE